MEISPDLHGILNCLDGPAILLGLDYRILLANDAYREIYGAVGGSRQRHCYEVSHGYSAPCDMAGESCPLKQSLTTGKNSKVLHIHHTPRGEEYVNVEMWPVKDPESGEIKYFLERMQPSEAGSTRTASDRLVGRSTAFQKMLGLVERVARSETTIMLLGETGTGKELVAQTIHRLSDRSDKPFVPVECTGLPDTLFESELFGYEKGAFTGAYAARGGLVDAAMGGTLFLDEVGEIPLAEQVKLLRLLETKRYRPVGGTEWKEADFRLICATNKSLSTMVEAGTFREDLYYRLNVFEIMLPALRERPEDVELLVAAILERLGKSDSGVSPDALAVLKRYRFPGNVRELRNVIERALLLTDGNLIDVEHLPAACLSAAPEGEDVEPEELVTLDEAEHRYLRRVLATTQLDRKELAAKLGISERALYRKLAELKRRPGPSSPSPPNR